MTKSIETLQKQVEKLQVKNRRQRERLENARSRIMEMYGEKLDVYIDCQKDILKTHNAINQFLHTFDECEGDVWLSDINRLRKARDKMRKKYEIIPQKDSEGRDMHYHYKWQVRDYKCT